jgi:hypothetical protein
LRPSLRGGRLQPGEISTIDAAFDSKFACYGPRRSGDNGQDFGATLAFLGLFPILALLFVCFISAVVAAVIAGERNRSPALFDCPCAQIGKMKVVGAYAHQRGRGAGGA